MYNISLHHRISWYNRTESRTIHFLDKPAAAVNVMEVEFEWRQRPWLCDTMLQVVAAFGYTISWYKFAKAQSLPRMLVHTVQGFGYWQCQCKELTWFLRHRPDMRIWQRPIWSSDIETWNLIQKLYISRPRDSVFSRIQDQGASGLPRETWRGPRRRCGSFQSFHCLCAVYLPGWLQKYLSLFVPSDSEPLQRMMLTIGGSQICSEEMWHWDSSLELRPASWHATDDEDCDGDLIDSDSDIYHSKTWPSGACSPLGLRLDRSSDHVIQPSLVFSLARASSWTSRVSIYYPPSSPVRWTYQSHRNGIWIQKIYIIERREVSYIWLSSEELPCDSAWVVS